MGRGDPGAEAPTSGPATDAEEDVALALAVCAEMVFLDRPLVDRVRRLHELGFAVVLWEWWAEDLAALAATGARFSSMTGYRHGDLTTKDGADALLEGAEESLWAAQALGTERLNLHGTGLGVPGRHVGSSRLTGGRPPRALWRRRVL